MNQVLKWACVTLAIYALFVAASAQGVGPNPVTTLPYTGAVTTNSSSTIGTGGSTFQSVFAAPTGNQRRNACVLQNNGTHTMSVFFGPIASATTGNSVALSAGQSVQCNVGGIALQDQVSITGTSGDAFYAAQQ
jgi:hypothetical protein